MKLVYGPADICEIVRKHAAEYNKLERGYAGHVELIVRDSDGGPMTDDCDVTVEVEIGTVPVALAERVPQ